MGSQPHGGSDHRLPFGGVKCSGHGASSESRHPRVHGHQAVWIRRLVERLPKTIRTASRAGGKLAGRGLEPAIWVTVPNAMMTRSDSNVHKWPLLLEMM